MSELSAFFTNHPYIAAVVGLAIGWLVRHRGFGGSLLPSLTAPTQAQAPPKAESRDMQAMPTPRTLTPGDVRNVMQDVLDARDQRNAVPAPVRR